MGIGKMINFPVQPDAFLYGKGIVKLLPAFNIVTDHIAQKNIGFIKRKVCMGQVVHVEDKDMQISDAFGMYCAIKKKLMPFLLFNSPASTIIILLRKNYKYLLIAGFS
jgi:hypothetical protein